MNNNKFEKAKCQLPKDKDVQQWGRRPQRISLIKRRQEKCNKEMNPNGY
jgi:hypothetical protein